MVNRRCSHKRQQGAAMVEAAIVMLVFMMLVFGIIEVSIAMLRWGQTVEATRAGARYAIVNDPVTSTLFDDLTCPGGQVVKTCDATGVDCTGLLGLMQNLVPNLEAQHVKVTYSCTDAGFDDIPKPIPSVTVEVEGLTHTLIIPTLLGVAGTWPVPNFETTRTGEDLHTVSPPAS